MNRPLDRRSPLGISPLAAALILGFATQATALAPTAPQDGVPWFQGDYEQALSQAKDEQKPVFIYFWANGSATSARFYQETLGDEEVVASLERFVNFSAGVNEQAGYDLLQTFGLQSLPSMVFVNPDGELEEVLQGFYPEDGFRQELDRVLARDHTISWFRAQAEADPKDLDARYQLAVKLQGCSDNAGYQEVVDAIKSEDPRGKSESAALLHFNDLTGTVTQNISPNASLAQMNFDPVLDHLAKSKHKRVRWQGYDTLSRFYYARGGRLEARKFMVEAVKFAPEDQILYWGDTVVQSAWGLRDELTRDEKKLALKLSKRCLKKAQEALETGDDGQGTYGYVPNRPLDDPDTFLALYFEHVGCMEFINGKTARAVAMCKKAIELDPDNTSYQQRLDFFQLER